MKITFKELKQQFFIILKKYGFNKENAVRCAQIFTDNTFDGVFSHGVNRFPFFIKLVQGGEIKPNAIPKRTLKKNNLEQWDGQMGPGPLNALFCMDRAVTLAKKQGMSCVGLKNTNHWMRAGAYGWHAARQGLLSMCFTNTKANLPPWGGKECRIGNNPLVLAVPYKDQAIVLDMAMSQYSFGKLGIYTDNKLDLPFPGGFDINGHLTTKPLEIKKSQRALPSGYWKGSGLSILLDLFVTIISGGRSVFEIYKYGNKDKEIGVSQVFMCISPAIFGKKKVQEQKIEATINFIKSAALAEGCDEIYYPGEKSLKNRLRYMKNGVEIPDKKWQKILNL